MSRRIVITCWGSYGDVYPYIGLAAALKARGHSPVIATSANYLRSVAQEGIEFAAVGPDVDPANGELIARAMSPERGGEVIVRELLLPHLRETYDELRRVCAHADLLVSHPITYAAPVLAERQQLPWVSTVLAPLLLFSARDLPVFPQLPQLVHVQKLGHFASRLAIGLARRATRDWFEPVARLRADLGLPRGGHPLFEGMFSPRGTLAMFSKLLAQPQPDWPPNVETTGFVFYNGRDALDSQLETFLAAGPPPVVFTLGTSAVGAAGRFYAESAEAARTLGVRAVLLTGDYARNRIAKLPDGVLAVERAPHQLLFARASAVVHHGGIGTTGQALRSGRPMLVVPHSHDQPDNARRVTRLGVARTLYARHYRAARVARELAALLRDGKYLARAAELAASVRTEGGAEGGAAAIEQALR